MTNEPESDKHFKDSTYDNIKLPTFYFQRGGELGLFCSPEVFKSVRAGGSTAVRPGEKMSLMMFNSWVEANNTKLKIPTFKDFEIKEISSSESYVFLLNKCHNRNISHIAVQLKEPVGAYGYVKLADVREALINPLNFPSHPFPEGQKRISGKID